MFHRNSCLSLERRKNALKFPKNVKMRQIIYFTLCKVDYTSFFMGRIPQKLKILNRVHVLRAEQRLSQQELADEIEVTRATVNAIESGDYNPSLELAFRIAKYFKTDIQNIFYTEEKRK